ncbi:hypothetical protein FRX31_007696 [Thalictrum thalictroides]|uniref:Uncharacterized protein n=1 Tax=Thalictrum thalictroides TaxID=46969 RepID=A0A7J6X0Y9_THATH|nr:hypothetical protein FRX31_007696 [Thalictrum thalictroides]
MAEGNSKEAAGKRGSSGQEAAGENGRRAKVGKMLPTQRAKEGQKAAAEHRKQELSQEMQGSRKKLNAKGFWHPSEEGSGSN